MRRHGSLSRAREPSRFLFQNLFVEKHLLPDGTAIDVGHIRTRNLLFDVTYGVTNRLTISANLPSHRPDTMAFGLTSVTGSSRWMMVRMHGTWQDFRIDVRYKFTRGLARSLRTSPLSAQP
jgi:hypothetical protein